MILDPRDTHVLVIRTWRERSAVRSEEELWRVSVEDVDSGLQRSFSDPSDVRDILEPILLRLGGRAGSWIEIPRS